MYMYKLESPKALLFTHLYFSLLPPCFLSSSSSSALVVDQSQAVKFALDIASGMAFLHTLEPMVSRLYLNSKHVMVRLCSSLSLTTGIKATTIPIKIKSITATHTDV